MNLFPELPAVPSPRIKWMEKKNIRTIRVSDSKWMAYKSGTQHNCTHEDEVDAIVCLSKKLKIKLWNE
jgi:hypothetical protein